MLIVTFRAGFPIGRAGFALRKEALGVFLAVFQDAAVQGVSGSSVADTAGRPLRAGTLGAGDAAL